MVLKGFRPGQGVLHGLHLGIRFTAAPAHRGPVVLVPLRQVIEALQIRLELVGVALEVLVGSELGGVDVDGNQQAIASCALISFLIAQDLLFSNIVNTSVAIVPSGILSESFI